MENISQMSLLEVAVQLMEEKNGSMEINELIAKVLEVKGLEDLDGSLKTQLYVDITTSSKFVYMGENTWDLKIRQPLEQFDKDGSAFNNKEDEYIEDDEDIEEDDAIEEDDDDDQDDDDLDDLDESDDDDEDDRERDDHDDREPEEDELDDDGDDLDIDVDFDEDKYDKYMDDYEDMYDEN